MRIMPRAIVNGVTATSLCLAVVLASPSRADVITDWNQTAIAAMKAANIAGNPWSRNMAMVHVAMSDAVNSVQNKYAIYAAGGAPAPSASAEAAAAAAARTVLLHQVPAQKVLIEQAFDASLPTAPPRRMASRSARSAGRPSSPTGHPTEPASPTPTGR